MFNHYEKLQVPVKQERFLTCCSEALKSRCCLCNEMTQQCLDWSSVCNSVCNRHQTYWEMGARPVSPVRRAARHQFCLLHVYIIHMNERMRSFHTRPICWHRAAEGCDLCCNQPQCWASQRYRERLCSWNMQTRRIDFSFFNVESDHLWWLVTRPDILTELHSLVMFETLQDLL